MKELITLIVLIIIIAIIAVLVSKNSNTAGSISTLFGAYSKAVSVAANP